MKWKQHFDKAFPLYHLSSTSLDGKLLSPRSMEKWRVMEGEDWRSKRVCLSDSIDGSLAALCTSMSAPFGEKFYVHVPENIDELFSRDNIYKPSTKQVPDAEETKEFWAKAPCKMKCIGRVEVISLDFSKKSSNVDFFTWKWIE